MIMDYKKILNKFRQNTKTPHCAAVVLAAGSSSRMGTDKTMLELGGIPVVIRSLMAFEKHELVDEIILVTREEMLQQAADLCHRYELKKLTAVIRGGSTRAADLDQPYERNSDSQVQLSTHAGAQRRTA